jgi:hypothetical protein
MMVTKRRLPIQPKWLIVVGSLMMLLGVVQPAVIVEAQDNPRVFRAELRLETASISDADTNNDISVKLSFYNDTWIDHARDDFERGDNHLYDLLLDNISRLSDIQYLRIRKSGTDAWCIKSIQLIINRGMLFSRTWPGAECHWMDQGGGFNPEILIPREEFDLSLPGSQPPRNTMDAANLQRLVESAVGHGIAGRYRFNGSDGAVDIADVSGDTLKVEVALREFNSSNTVEMSFNLIISCQNEVRVRIDKPVIRRFVAGLNATTSRNPDPLMEDTRRYLRQVLNRRVRDCSTSNTIVVTNGPEIRIHQ